MNTKAIILPHLHKYVQPITSFVGGEEYKERGMGRNKQVRKQPKKHQQDIIMTFVYFECRRLQSINRLLIEIIINRARAMNVSNDPIEVIKRVIRFAKKNARLEPEARDWIVREFGYTKIPEEAVFATVSA